MPGDFRINPRVWGQWSPNRLPDAGKFNLGGGRSIRGYRESEVAGDGGFAYSVEVLSPSFVRLPSLPQSGEAGETAGNATEDTWRALRPLDVRMAAFYDAGLAYQSGPRPSHAPRRTTGLAGAGFGLRLQYAPWLSVSADYAWRLRDTGVIVNDRVRGYGYLTINASF